MGPGSETTHTTQPPTSYFNKNNFENLITSLEFLKCLLFSFENKEILEDLELRKDLKIVCKYLSENL